MSPAQLARLQAARRLPNSATVAIVLDEYAALIPTLKAADSVPTLQGEIAHLRSALAAQVAATEAERATAAKAKAHADEVRKSLQAGKATAESRALRAEAALNVQASADAAELEALRQQLAVAERKIADQSQQIHNLTPVRRQQPRGTGCEVEGCTVKHYARGLCIKHYQRDKRKLAAGICLICKAARSVGRSGRCRPCYLAIVTERGREAARCAHD